MHAYGILSKFPFHLSYSLKIRSTLNVANSSTDFSNNEIIMVFLSEQLNVALNLVGNMRHDLNGLSQIISPSLLIDNSLINTSCSQRVRLSGLNTSKALIVTKVKVGFHTVHGNITLTMFIRVKSSRVDVDVGVELLNGNVVPPCLQQFTN